MSDDNWIPVEWQHMDDVGNADELMPISIHRMRSPFYDGARFCVRRLGDVLSTSGKWGHEPQPSSRTDAFYKRFRFKTFTEARAAAERARDRISMRENQGGLRRAPQSHS